MHHLHCYLSAAQPTRPTQFKQVQNNDVRQAQVGGAMTRLQIDESLAALVDPSVMASPATGDPYTPDPDGFRVNAACKVSDPGYTGG